MERDRRAGRPRAAPPPRDVLSDALRPPARGPRARDASGGAARAPTTRDAHSTLADPRTPRGLGATATESCPTHENLSALQLRDPPRASRADRTGDAREGPRRRRVSSVGRSERDRDRGRGAEGRRRRRRLRSSSSPRRRLAARLLGVPPPAKRATELILRGLARRTEPRRGRGGRSEARIRVCSPGSRRRRRRRPRPRGRRPRPRGIASSPEKPARGPPFALGPRDARRRPTRTPTLRRRSSSPRGG